MKDVLQHPIMQWLVGRGYKIAVHTYVNGEKIKTTVAAKDPKNGALLQGWGPEALSALRDLARRSGVKALADLARQAKLRAPVKAASSA